MYVISQKGRRYVQRPSLCISFSTVLSTTPITNITIARKWINLWVELCDMEKAGRISWWRRKREVKTVKCQWLTGQRNFRGQNSSLHFDCLPQRFAASLNWETRPMKKMHPGVCWPKGSTAPFLYFQPFWGNFPDLSQKIHPYCENGWQILRLRKHVFRVQWLDIDYRDGHPLTYYWQLIGQLCWEKPSTGGSAFTFVFKRVDDNRKSDQNGQETEISREKIVEKGGFFILESRQ